MMRFTRTLGVLILIVAAPAARPDSAPPFSLTFGNPIPYSYYYDRGISFDWRVPTSELRSAHVAMMRVMKRNAAGEVSVLEELRVDPGDDDPIVKFAANDPQQSHRETATYFLVPVDETGRVGAASPEAHYSVDKYPETPGAFRENDLDVYSLPRLPQADDPLERALSSAPAMLGKYGQDAPKCSFEAAPGSAQHCQRPAGPVDVWLRADDNHPRLPRVRTWPSPRIVQSYADGGPDVARQPWRLKPDPSGIAPIRFTNATGLAFARPRALEEFTVIVVGRQVGGATGPLLSSADGVDSLFWREGKELVLRHFGRSRTGKGVTEVAVPYSGIDKLHILVVHYLVGSGRLLVIANGESVATRYYEPARRLQADFIGAPGSQANVLDRMASAFSASAPPPEEGSDIAEIIVYSGEVDEEQLVETLRYLRKKYSLP